MARSQETRLGIVLYGGVSLAIYENGVAQELFRAARGEPGKQTVYDLVKAIADTEIVVDIVSGTSAGGVNGIMLGYALANNGDFLKSADLWREKGDLALLLRKPGEDNVNSVLDSQGFYQPALEEAFRTMTQGPAYGSPYTGELDLFVTGTDVHGRVFTEFDDQGHAIDIKDHRAVFRLSYRPERKNDFSDWPYERNIPALAKLARVTSCFPVAFEPVQFTNPELPKTDDDYHPDADTDPDLWLKRWGQLTQETYFLDGGILNNKPFSYTIDAIFGRLAECPVDRMLFYVEPDPEQFTAQPLTEIPSVAKAAGDALIGIPGYQSISQDLQAIAERNSRVAQYGQMLKCLGDPNPLDPYLATPPRNPFAILGPLNQPSVCAYLSARLMQMRDRAIVGILKQDGSLRLLDPEEKHAASMLVKSFDRWPTDGTDTLRDFDVDFHLRRLYRCIYALEARAERNATPDPAYAGIRRRLNHQIKMLEMVRFAMETVLDNSKIPWADLKELTHADWAKAEPKWHAVQNLIRAVLDATPAIGDAGIRDWSRVTEAARLAQERAQRKTFMQALADRIDALDGSKGDEPPAVSGNLLQALEDQERAILRNHPLLLEYNRFLQVDALLYPIEALSGIRSKDKIRTVRFSPIGDKFGFGKGKDKVSDKLCGVQLAAFGGFLKKSWRANDIMWGRLDALSQLLQCVVTRERIRKLAARPYDFAAALSACDLARVFPSADAAARGQLQGDLNQLPACAADPALFQTFLDRLIRAAQAEIVNQEMPRVIRCAIDQQVEWNRFSFRQQSTVAFDPATQSWKLGVDRIDSVILSAASDRLLDRGGAGGSWVEFLEEDYKVPSETLATGIPLPVAGELASHAALVLENCLPGVAGAKKADSIRSSTWFRLLLVYPLRGLYTFTAFQRNAPELARSATLAILLLSIAGLAAGIVWHDPLLYDGHSFYLLRFAILIAAPLMALLLLFGLWVMAILLPAALLAAVFALAATAGWLSQWQKGLGAISTVITVLYANRLAIWISLAAGALGVVVAFSARWLRRKAGAWVAGLRQKPQPAAPVAPGPGERPAESAAATAAGK